jgi:hypothetical protein
MRIVKVQAVLERVCREDRGGLTFEWISLITLLVIGIVGGYSALRDGIIDELGDVVGAVISVDQSFATEGPPCAPHLSYGSYTDLPNDVCRQRAGGLQGKQNPIVEEPQ